MATLTYWNSSFLTEDCFMLVVITGCMQINNFTLAYTGCFITYLRNIYFNMFYEVWSKSFSIDYIYDVFTVLYEISVGENNVILGIFSELLDISRSCLTLSLKSKQHNNNILEILFRLVNSVMRFKNKSRAVFYEKLDIYCERGTFHH